MVRTLLVILISLIWLAPVAQPQPGEGSGERPIAELVEIIKPKVEPSYGGPCEKEELGNELTRGEKSEFELELVSGGPRTESIETRTAEATDAGRKAPLDRHKQAIEHNELGNLYEGKGMYEEAIAEYEKAIKLDPQLAMAYSNLGNVYSRMGKLNKAIAKYKKAIRIDPRAPFAHNNLGNTYYARGDYSKAIREYKVTIILDPTSAYAYNNLGDAYLHKGLPNLAIRYFKKAIELDPDSFTAYSNLGDAYQATEDLEKAIVAYEKALEIQPEYGPAREELGRLRLKRSSSP